MHRLLLFRRLAGIMLLVAALAAPALANPMTVSVWNESPGPLWALAIFAIAVVIEYPFVQRLTSAKPLAALAAVVAMNVITSLIGVPFIPTLRRLFEIEGFPSIERFAALEPNLWVSIFLFTLLLGAVLHTTTLAVSFKRKTGLSTFWWLTLANGLSIGMALVLLLNL